MCLDEGSLDDQNPRKVMDFYNFSLVGEPSFIFFGQNEIILRGKKRTAPFQTYEAKQRANGQYKDYLVGQLTTKIEKYVQTQMKVKIEKESNYRLHIFSNAVALVVTTV